MTNGSNKRFSLNSSDEKLTEDDRFFKEEVQLAFRNRGIPLEGLRYPITPTGMHYLLTRFDVPEVDVRTWRLVVGGLVANPMELSLEDIRKRPAVTHVVTMECAGNGRALLNPRYVSQPWFVEAISTAEWTGTPLRGLLADARVRDEAMEIVFTGLDQGLEDGEIHYYQRSLSMDEAIRDEMLLVYAMNGEPLPPQHGYPLRLLVPGWYGMASVKWLSRIEAIGERFEGYYMEGTYRYMQSEQDPGEPVTLMKVRALMVPPGIPDFKTRIRLVRAGPVTLTGRAWVGRSRVSRVEVSTDGGATWSRAELGEQLSPYAWRAWSCGWDATPGQYTLCVRATDADGHTQPVDQPWNFQGMGNNMAQRVQVVVE